MHTLYILWCAVLGLVAAIELTFELPDNANQCFYEDMKAGIDSVIEFQVSFAFLSRLERSGIFHFR